MSTDQTADLAAVVAELRDRVGHLEDIEAPRNPQSNLRVRVSRRYSVPGIFQRHLSWTGRRLLATRRRGRDIIGGHASGSAAKGRAATYSLAMASSFLRSDGGQSKQRLILTRRGPRFSPSK